MSLINEDGYRWMDATEQYQAFPSSRELHPYINRPVWLVLSIGLREQGIKFKNGLDVMGQMKNIRTVIGE